MTGPAAPRARTRPVAARVRAARRRRLLAVVALLASSAGVAVASGGPDAVHADPAAGPIGIESQIGPVAGATLLGAATASQTPGETWALVPENRASRVPKTVDGQPLPETKDYIARYRPAEGWRYVQAPLDEHGQPYAGTLTDGRVTARGGLAFGGVDPQRPEGARHLALIRDAVGPTRVVPLPGPDVLRPASVDGPAESLSGNVLAARDRGDGGTEAFFAIVGPALHTAVAHWDGEQWSRETLCVATDGTTPPSGCSAAETLLDADQGTAAVSIATAEGGDAWLSASTPVTAGRGLVVFRRTGSGPTVRWALRPLGAPRFETRASAADGIGAVLPLDSPHGATATADGVWVDGSFRQDGATRSVTVRITARGTTTWCDGGACDGPLGTTLRTDARSQAWPGDARVVGPVGATNTRYARFDGGRWTVSAAFGSITGGLAFSTPDEGWLNDVHVTRDRPASPLAVWSVPVRRPLTAIASAPGAPGDLTTPALAVGLGGNVLRYTPGQGWDSEVRMSGSSIARDTLRGVAWPEPSTAFAVGDEGTMWRWRQATGLWESDPAAPYDFVGHLTGVAFQPGDPDRGFAVGRDGVLLRYGKSWEPMVLPEAARSTGPSGGNADIFGVSFAGPQALAAAGAAGVLIEDGAGWTVDPQVAELLRPLGAVARVLAVSGLPDGGAVAAGSAGDNRGFVLTREAIGAPWRFSDQPPSGAAFAAAAFREDGLVRALISVSPRPWPSSDDLNVPIFDPNAPTPRRQPLSVPTDGYLLRQTAAGWRDEERTKLSSPTADPARKSDPVLALLADAAGRGWVVGGWMGGADSAGRGPSADEPAREELQTAAVNRYDPAGPTGSSNVRVTDTAFPAGRARLLVGGHAQCAGSCADLAPIDISPDRTLLRGLGLASSLAAQVHGPRALAYTGGRLPSGGTASPSDLQRYAALLGSGALPTFPTVSDGELGGGTSSGFEGAFAGSWAPFGGGAVAPGTREVAIGANPLPGRARTHYATDIDTTAGTVRLAVIDNASGSLAARNAAGNPVQDQAGWLASVLADARQRGIPTVVSGNRSLNPRDVGAASDATATAVLLRDGGASAYVYDGAGEQRRGTIPVGSEVSLPTFGSGTLGYRAAGDVEGRGVSGLLVLELDTSARDAASNRAPATVRLLPVLEDLAIDAVDGRVLNRSQPALFNGLGRRPRAGDTGDPFVALPSPPCAATAREACQQTRIDPEVTFHSSAPDIVDFVRVDPTSTNPRKPYVDPTTDKPVPDASSGLVCPFNAGTATISISSGGLTYSTTVTVRDGSVLRPCGTVPLDPTRFPPPAASAASPPAATPDSAPAASPSVASPPPPVPVGPAPPTPPAASPPSPSVPAVLIPAVALPALVSPPVLPPVAVPPPPPAATQAPPPGTSGGSVSQQVSQHERQREEELAEEGSQAYARYDPAAAERHPTALGSGPMIAVAVLLLAVAGGSVHRGRHRTRPSYAYARTHRSRPRSPR